MIKSHITDNATKRTAKVLPEGELLVNTYTSPPLLPQKTKIYSAFLTDDGTTTGSSDLGVNGSVTPVDFYVQADDEDDVYIGQMSFVLGYGSSGEGYEFADSGAALTNGIRIYYTDRNGEVEVNNIKGNFDFWRASLVPVSQTAWEQRGFAGLNDYGYFVTIPLNKIVPPFGIKLDRGTKQRLSVIIRDDCTDADLFNCEVFGFKRFE